MEPTPATAAQRIQQLIESLRISPYQFAKEVGLSHQTISNVTNGKSKPSHATMEAIASRYPQAVSLLFPVGPVAHHREAYVLPMRQDGTPAALPPERPSIAPSQVDYVAKLVGRLEQTIEDKDKELEEKDRLIEELRAQIEDLRIDKTELRKKPEGNRGLAASTTRTRLQTNNRYRLYAKRRVLLERKQVGFVMYVNREAA